MNCHVCNAEMRESKEQYHYTESGLDNIYLEDIIVYYCECGEFCTNTPEIIELQTLIGKLIVQKTTPLNGKEIVFLRKNIGFNAIKFAENIGIDKSTLSRWENNNQSPSKSNDRFIRLLYATVKGLPGEDIICLLEKAAKDFDKKTPDKPIYIPIDDEYMRCSI